MNIKCFEDFCVTPSPVPNDGLMFADHSPSRRSGHLGHALAECLNGELLAFYPSCNDDNNGHSGNGWMEFKRSFDYGQTWENPVKLDYSFDMWASKCGRTAMAEKAVTTDTGAIVLFHLICDMQVNGSIWEPYWEPTYTRSEDHGHTWSDAKQLCPLRGRVYDALYKDGVIYALMFANDATVHYAGILPGHQYQLYESHDDGRTFSLSSTLSINPQGRCYGTMEFMENGDLIVYVYNLNDEYHADYCVSHDNGITWCAPGKSYFAKCIRNPQLVRFGDGYFLHGRSGSLCADPGHFVIYFSNDGFSWDAGHCLRKRGPGAGAYSNNLVVKKYGDPTQDRLLIHASHPYDAHRTNVVYWWIDRK